MQIKVFHYFFFQILCLLGISSLSTYKVPDLKDADWQTVMFLTPIGIIKNYLDTNPVMRSFYSDPSKGQIILSYWQRELIIFLLIIQVFYFYKFLNLIRQ